VAVHAVLWAVYALPRPKVLWADEAIYWQAAAELAGGGGARLDLLWPPLYPHFLALLSRAGGDSVLVVQLVQSLMLIAVALILRAIVLRLGASPVAAATVALLTLAYPPLASFAHYLWPEILHLLLFVAALWILLARAGDWRWMPLLGLLLGLALLTKSLLGPFLAVLLVPLLLDGGAMRRRLLCLGLTLAALAATVAPTLIATHQRTGQWLLADSAAFNVWVGLNDRSRRNFVDPIAGNEYQRFRASAASHAERVRIV
jgi:4-amino-4-deoxy-L-arabinose transferase-like glycosyltransferase